MGCRGTASQCRLAGRDMGRRTAPTIRSVWLPHGFRSCITIRQCLIRSFSTVGMQSTEAMRSIELGGPASHGCIRLHPANAAALFALVKSEGMAATTIVVSGTSPVVASGPARSPRTHRGGESRAYHERGRRDYGRERLANEGRYRSNYGWERPAYGDTYRPDYGRSYYYWRPEPRAFPSFNSY